MIPFTGRVAERRLIASTVARVRDGAPAALVVLGPAGAGKSRLLREWSADGVRRIDVVGYEPEGGVAFAAVGGLLEVLLGAESLRAVGAGVGGGPAEPLRIFEAAFAALASAGPTVLVVDDLQWLDASSAALVHYLVRGALASDLPVGLIAASRPGPESAPTVEALERLFGDGPGLVVHHLPPLGEADAVALVCAAVPAMSEDAAERLWQRVGGSPYWLLALARATSDEPGAVLHERLERLSVDAATVLGALAVAGRPIDREQTTGLLQWAPDRLDAAVRELSRTGIIVEGVDGLRPAHDLVRETVLAELPERTRRDHHARLARTLEQQAGSDLRGLATALGHRLASGEPAVELALRVATAPDRRLLGAVGLIELERVLAGAAPDDPALADLRVAVARLASELAASESAFALWRDLAANGQPAIREEALLAAAHEAHRLHRPDEVRALIKALGKPADPLTAIEIGALEASSMLWLEARFADGKARAGDLLPAARRMLAELAGRVEDDTTRRTRTVAIAALKVAFEASMQAEEWQILPALAAELVAASAGLGGRARMEALLYDGMALRYHGNREESAERYRVALDVARREQLPDQIVEAGTFLAGTLEALGRLDEAEAIARDTVELAERVGDYSKLRARPRTLLSEIHLSRGPWPEALSGIEADTEGLDSHYRLTLWQVAASAVSRIQGRPSAGRVERLVADSLADAERAGCPRCRREAQLVNAGSLARVGRPVAARELLAAANATPTMPEPYVDDMRAWAEALLEPSPAAAELRLGEVIDACRRTGRHIDALWARIDLGRLLVELDPARAAAVLREAGRDAAALGAATQAQVADRLLRRLGQRTWRRSSAGGGPLELTEREREVARWVAAGASNAEIADGLFVSVKTVERHLSNLFAKFDVRNRTELARAWAQSAAKGDEESERRQG